MALLAARIGNDVSYVMRSTDAIHFVWQAQYLVKLECDIFVAGAALVDILGDSRSAKCCIFQYKMVAKIARGRSPKRRVRDDNFIVGYPRISSDVLGLSSNRLYIGGSNSGILRCNPELRISWQAQYLVRLEGGFVCSAHWK